ncbi:MAG TPA: PEPxxWA-CTERM sorting domain-containing protein, partial [Caulobacteraceae bacterium]
AIFSTYRSCAAVGAATVCDGNGPGQNVLFPSGNELANPGGPYGPSVLGGGDMLSSTGAFTVAAGSSDSNITFQTPNSQPVMSGDVNALSNVRIGSNGVAYYTYTNTGGVGVALTLAASIAFSSSSVSPSGVDGGSLPGGAKYSASVAIVDPSYLANQLSGPNSFAYGAGYTAADTFALDMEYGVTGATCGTAGVDAFGTTIAATSGGAGGTSVSTSACGGGGAYVVAPGQSVIILDWYHLDANRGGEVDPLVMQYTQAPIPDALAVPEPSAWALMLAGTAMLGGALRRRPRLAKLTL